MSAPTCEAIVPLASGKLCSWCHPNVDWPEGHSICVPHRDEELLRMHMADRASAQAPTQSPKENPKHHE